MALTMQILTDANLPETPDVDELEQCPACGGFGVAVAAPDGGHVVILGTPERMWDENQTWSG